MNDAQQEMSPDFVLMRLVSAAEYDRLDEPDDLMSGGGGFGPVKAALGHRGGGFELDSSGPSAGLGSASPHYSSPLPGKGELDGGLVLSQASPGSEAPLSPPPPEDFAVAAQRFVDFPVPHGQLGGPGSRAQLMVFQNLLRSGDRILECGLEQPPPRFLQEEQRQQRDPDSGTGPGGTTAGPGGGRDQNSHCIPPTEDSLQSQPQLLQWHPVLRLSKSTDGSQNPQQGVPALDSDPGSVLCHRHRLLTDRLAKWPPGLLDQALRVGLLEPRKNCPSGGEDPVLALARRLGQLGEGREGGGGEDTVLPLPRCSCHSILAPGPGGMGPGEDPSETSDALLVLEGLGSEEVGGLGRGGDGEEADKGEVGGVGVLPGGAGPVFSSGTLSGLMRQVHRLAEEAGVCTDQTCRSSLAVLPPHSSASCPYPPVCPQAPQAAATLSGFQPSPDPLLTSGPDPAPRPQHQHQSRSQPQSRAATPKLGLASGGPGRAASPLVVLEGEVGGGGLRDGEKTPRGKSRKGGSLKVRLSKLFRTKSSSGGSGGLLDKRPSLASSTSSGGSLLDVWGSTCSNTEQDSSRLQVSRPHSAFSPVPFTPAFTGETVSLVDVDISRRGGSSLHPPTPPPPPRRSLSLLDDFGGPPQQQGPFMERSVGASMQSLPPRPMALPPSLSTIQHSLSLNDTFLRGLPRPVPLRPDGHPPPRLAPRCPLSRPDAGSFATSLRELEKCGWYWGPMNWEDAEMKLKGKPDGSFLVRDSSDPRYILSLSFRSQGVTHHTRMEHYRGTFSLWCHPKFEDRCHSVVEFIERAIMHSKNGKFLYFLRSRVPGKPPTPVQLLYPVSRFSSVKSLQHLCRFCIRQLVRIDHIQELPLPTPLIAYLRKFYYYDPEEEISPTLNELKEPREMKEPSPDQSSQPGVESQT
ncbi:LOW QUALITY PROTEIN: suppressor of cytokine signaling 7-like [Acanthochromis polyacanthus]|uniref:LOW QUALITY PROTEIN: suppressor of cytokine signaling 7-like n=1 Tax=Acanthochromis polyacanthus TaxID=80966 RepID=UPI002233F25D|nr:LOW QUALITY PROTEIN: suppressor of cytokine signaling 7-like [Acanthochromis polyacanthus]